MAKCNFIILALILVTSSALSQPEAKPVLIGDYAPDFSATTVDGKPFKLSDLRGKYVLLNFWGTWCMGCIAELPDIKDVKLFYGGKDFEIVSIANEFTQTNVKSFIDSMRMPWTHIAEYNPGDNSIKMLYGIDTWPSTFLIDKNGKFVEFPTSYVKDNNGKLKYIRYWGSNINTNLKKYINPTLSLESHYTNGRGILISYSKQGVTTVEFAGDFNKWAAIPMYKYKDKWFRRFDLPPGLYKYKLIVDGKWITDPSNPNMSDDGKGNINSELLIR